MKPLPPAWSAARCRADISGSSGRGNGIRSMSTSWQAAPGTSRPCQRLSVPNRQVCGSLDELLGQLGQLGVALGEQWQVREPLAHRLGRGLGRARRGEQPERAAVGGVDEVGDLVELGRRPGRRGRAAAGAGRRRGSPAGRSRTASRRRARATAARPSGVGRRSRRRPSTTPLGGLSPTLVATASKSPPSISVAQVSTTVLSAEQLVAQRPPHLQRRDAQQPRPAVVAALGEPEHVGPRRLRPVAPPSARRSSKTSCTRAARLGAAGVGVAGVVPRLGVRREAGAGGVAHQHQRVGQLLGIWSNRPGSGSGDRVASASPRVGEVVGLGAVDEPAAAGAPPARRRRR